MLFRSVFRDFLAELGHDPVVVRSAEAALGTLERQRPDAIILDINLPGMSGLDFLQLRPVREAGLPIVAISGVATESQARECLRLGALDFVGKPVPLERLNEVLTFLEPHALTRRSESARQSERRRGPRVQIGFPVRIVEYKGTAWDGICTELSATGMKVRSGATLSTAISSPRGSGARRMAYESGSSAASRTRATNGRLSAKSCWSRASSSGNSKP